MVNDCNAAVIRTGEAAQALLTALACVLAMSPSATRSPAAIRRTVDEIGKRLRKQGRAAERPDCRILSPKFLEYRRRERMSTALQAAQAYVARGWNPLPLPFKSKIPNDIGWQKRVIARGRHTQILQRSTPEYRCCSRPIVERPDRCRPRLPGGHRDRAEILPKTGAIFGRRRRRRRIGFIFIGLSQLDKATIQFRDPTSWLMTRCCWRFASAASKARKRYSLVRFTRATRKSAGMRPEPRGFDHDLLKRAHLLASACLLARYWPERRAP